MMGIVAPCIVGFSMRLGVNESGTGFAMLDMIPYDRTCVRLTMTNCRYHKHGKKLKDSGFRSLVKFLSCWTICEEYHQVSSTSKANKKSGSPRMPCLGAR